MTECAICETPGPDVRVGLVQWTFNPGRFDTAPRCEDRAACAERVMLSGRAWPVVERDHSSRIHPTGREATPAPPVPSPEPIVPDDPRSWW